MVIPLIVTMAQARAHLRRTDEVSSPGTSADLDLALKLRQANAVVVNVCIENVSRQHFTDADDATAALEAIEVWTPMDINADGSLNTPSPDTTAPAEVIAAVLMLLAELDRFRGDDPGTNENPPRSAGQLSDMARAYLGAYLTPVVS